MAEIAPVVWWAVNFVQGQYYDITCIIQVQVLVQVTINLLAQQLVEFERFETSFLE